MKYWIIPANKNHFDYHKAFADLKSIDWTASNFKFNIGDIVYIYSTDPIKKIEYKCEVVDINIKYENMIDDEKYWVNLSYNSVDKIYVRLKKVQQFNTELLNLDKLMENGLNMAPRSAMFLSEKLKSYIESVEVKVSKKLLESLRQKFLVVDHDSGSYNIDNIGHELFNEKPNLLDNKYYAYVPPYSSVDITKLGAAKEDKYIDNIIVLFVTKIDENNTDRLITGLYPSARVYRNKLPGEDLQRFFEDKDGKVKASAYSIESENYIPLHEYFLIVKTKEINNYLFRGQRVYSGTYPELDELIYSYLELILESDIDDDSEYQKEINLSNPAFDEEIKNAVKSKVNIIETNSGKKVKRNNSLAKSAIERANFKCEINEMHSTFLNMRDEQYMEGHHLIPLTVRNAVFFEEKFGKNIDCIENIVSLCPNCHKAIHLGNDETKKKIIQDLYNERKEEMDGIEISISLNELFNFYNINV